MTDLRRRMRLSQTVAPFGVGAIFDLLGESFIAPDINWWGHRGRVLRLERLERELGKRGFRSAPTVRNRFDTKSPGLAFVRFPKVLFCPNCRSVRFWRRTLEIDGDPARCGCARAPVLVPMRFVAVCPRGHLHDVPWTEWAHSTAKEPQQKQCHSPNLALLTSDRGSGGLDALTVFCRKCKASRSLSGISANDSLKPLEGRYATSVRCRGTQPWQRADAGEPCGMLLQIVQRGATNVYFAHTASAIDIPPGSDYDPYSELALRIKAHPNFPAMLNAKDGPITPILAAATAAELNCDEETVLAVVAQEAAYEPEPDRGRADDAEADPQSPGPGGDEILTGEWRAFTAPDREYHPRSNFIKTSAPLLEPGTDVAEVLRVLDASVSQVALASRLREVRALVSFSRYEGDRTVPVDLGRDRDWLPAIEVFGEGIFIAFDEACVARWEMENTGVGNLLEKRRQRALIGARLPEVTSRYVMLHTFAHLLIRQLVFECGYSAASLRERVYSCTPEQDDPQAGILVYTAAGDVEGTLGGLVRQGRPPRLAITILRALERGTWCSSDPLCRENPGQGFGSLNLAACHACSLLPETSCETGNKLLDRGLVVGDDKRDVRGFFENVLDTVADEAAVKAVV